MHPRPANMRKETEGMLVGSKYKLESDGGFNIIVYRKAKSKGGDESWRIEGYFGTLKNALRSLVDAEVRNSGLRDLKQITQKQDELYQLIKSLNLPGEPPTTPASVLDAPASAQKGDKGCNMARAKENHGGKVVTAPKKVDVTEKVRELANKGMSSRKIADTLAGEGIEISHMTIIRKLQGAML